MNLTQAILLAIVEGITEYLPISSTAHMIITSTYLRLPQSAEVTLFEVVIQTGAIVAVLVLYGRTLLQHKDYIFKIIASFIPTAVIGLLMHDTVKSIFFQSNTLISTSLIVVGMLFIALEWAISKKFLELHATIDQLTYKHALVIGVIQASAIVPGISRAGAVMVGMMAMGYKRTDAALYSFMLAVPTLAAAAVLDIFKTDPQLFTQSLITTLLIGILVSFFTALVCIKWLIGYLQRNTLVWFGVYRIAVGIVFYLSSTRF